jgi:hypothetical protein
LILRQSGTFSSFIFVFALRSKTKTDKNDKDFAAVRPERVEGQAKRRLSIARASRVIYSNSR